MCAGGVNQVGMILIALMIKFKRQEYIHYLTVPYLLNHAISSVFVYKEWLPDSWNKYPKENVEMQLLMNFIMCSAVPIQDFRVTIFATFPIYVIAALI